jgi:hypothetical protein
VGQNHVRPAIGVLVLETPKPVDSKNRTRGLLNHVPKARRHDLSVFAYATCAFAGMSRFLLISIAISLITMPVTQHIWTWDHFLRGGHDFELTTLLVLSFLGMALVLSRQFKDCLDSLFASWRLLSVTFNDSMQGRISIAGAFSRFPAECLVRPPVGIYRLPLKI